MIYFTKTVAMLIKWREEFEDTKGVIRIRISKKDIQHNGEKKIEQTTNNNLQNITLKNKDRSMFLFQ
jgi:hypothetical protein